MNMFRVFGERLKKIGELSDYFRRFKVPHEASPEIVLNVTPQAVADLDRSILTILDEILV